MKWDKYSDNYLAEAHRRNLSEILIKENLDYAYNLFIKRIPIIYDIEHLSKLVGYNIDYINRAIKNTTRFYRHFKIPKKTDGFRLISEPLPSLKEIQEFILREILEKCPVSKFAKAYIKKKSLRSNAIFHRNKTIILTIDIKDFFGSIKKNQIKEVFKSIGYHDNISDVLSGLCVLNNSLPQGAPTSPALSNLIAFNLDERISSYCLENKIAYTRYSVVS